MTRKAVCLPATSPWWEEDYSGLASQEEHLRSTAEAVGRHRAVILPNHGAITTAPNVQIALFAMLLLEGMVARNLSVAAAARDGTHADIDQDRARAGCQDGHREDERAGATLGRPVAPPVADRP